MTALEKKITRQKNIFIAHGHYLGLCNVRFHQKLGKPSVIVSAFTLGIFSAIAAPLFMKALPKLTARLGYLNDELNRLQRVGYLVGAMVPMLLKPFIRKNHLK